MNVLIPALTTDTVATRALRCEGLDVTATTLEHPFAYAAAVAAAWQSGQGFVIVEDDIAPWPGAVEALWACEEPWCAHDYSIGLGRFGLGTLGCVKFSAALTREHPDLWHGWLDVPWRHLDHAVIGAVTRCGYERHRHTPAVAHARHYRHP